MRVADLMKPEGRVFLKSEFGQISSDWPCLSFTKRSVGDKLRRDFSPGRDVLIYVGTTNAEMTELPEHRSRLISAVSIEPNHILETRKIVPAEIWAKSILRWGARWPHSMAVLDAANMIGPPYPDAHKIIPIAYRTFADYSNRGSVVEALGEERQAVMQIPVERVDLTLSEDVTAYLKLRLTFGAKIDKSVKQEITRLAQLIVDRVKRGGEPSVSINPLRTAPNFSDLYALLLKKWQDDQMGLCGLCGGGLFAMGKNKMLQPSCDRIDSNNGAYNEENVQIAHLACNLAKNQYGREDFEEWLEMVRGVDAAQQEIA